jgi:hypothetical protein
MGLRDDYEVAKARQKAALGEWRQVTLNVNRLREELGEAGELTCDGCDKALATDRCKGCGRWFCGDCHKERCG